MARNTLKKQEPIPVVNVLLPLSLPGARLLVVDRKIHILEGSNHRMMREKQLEALRLSGLIEPLRQIDECIAVSMISPHGRYILDKMLQESKGYTQLKFDDLTHRIGHGDALTSEIVS